MQITVLNQKDQTDIDTDLLALLYRRGFTPIMEK